MRSCTKLILLIFSTVTLILVTESRRTIPSNKEIKELEKLLNHINKPALKSFKTKHGYVLDCIDIQKQLAFDHPLLKNHSIQLKPTSIPKWTRDNNTSEKSSSLPFRQEDDNIRCPLGTVIIKRTTLEDLIQIHLLKLLGEKPVIPVVILSSFAIAEYYKENHGGMGNINIWDPPVKPDQFSLASISIQNGLRDRLQSISAGWMADGDNKTGCYNTVCPGFVQVSSKFGLGTLAKPVSTYDGEQYILQVIIFQDHITGNWWFLLKGNPIGYWPRSLFNGEGIANGASRVFSAVRQRISPIMGSGHFPQEGYRKAAFVNGLKVIDHVSEKNTSPPASNIAIFANSPRASDLILFANSPTCYKVETKSGVGEYWSTAIYFGGPGGF
ncbi:PREDICTED: uncharacterized protein LOC104710952 [Camelina sativa]|uniref:Uncharacterized protein LOC104710952 n=1 Tax=Camelina sativa TaxID=90675 RepID=A0ABM0TG54_CAMSA|nr:PREDICTED: uncharacterized protein LOC104710952 [Camelina sativa]